MSRPCTVYRHYDAAGRLLYVGISARQARRQSEHRAAASWAKRIARIETQDFATRGDAHAAERAAIRAENPLHNRTRYGSDTGPTSRGVAFMPALDAAQRARLARALPNPSFDRELTHKQAAHVLHIRPNELRQLAPFPGCTSPLTAQEVVEIGWRLIVGAAIVDPFEIDELNTFLPPRVTAKALGGRHPLVDAAKLAEGGAHEAAAEIVARHHTKFRTLPLCA